MTDIKVGQKWRHVKRGSVYEIVHTNASAQVSFLEKDGLISVQQLLEDAVWIAYKPVNGYALHFRINEEFLDGRFVLVEDVD